MAYGGRQWFLLSTIILNADGHAMEKDKILPIKNFDNAKIVVDKGKTREYNE